MEPTLTTPAAAPRIPLGSLLRTAFEESPGVLSSMRIQMFIVMFLTIVMPLSIWAAFCWTHRNQATLPDFPQGVFNFCTVTFSASAAAKVFQYRSEPDDRHDRPGQ